MSAECPECGAPCIVIDGTNDYPPSYSYRAPEPAASSAGAREELVRRCGEMQKLLGALSVATSEVRRSIMIEDLSSHVCQIEAAALRAAPAGEEGE